jgi:hypothetical protein
MMKRTVLLLFIILCVASCKKKGFSPEGPTDIRIYNKSDQTFTNVIVNTTNIDTAAFNFGTIAPNSYSEYHRFSKAYNKAEITVTIHNPVNNLDEIFTTGRPDNTYQAYLSTIKATYVVWISDYPNKKIAIFEVVPESDLNE